jgi:peptidoglycan hydrolase-like protein with peptidoglycan-binding domain
MNKKYIVSMIVVAIIAISNISTANAFYLGQRGQEVVDLQITLIEAGYDIPAISSGIASPGYFGTQTQAALARRDAAKPRFGAVAGPDLFSDYFNVNGVANFYNRVGLTQASTTICAMRSPTSTSTLEHGSVQFKVGSTSAMYVELAKSTTAFATTTRIGSPYVVAANAQASIVASTTGSVAGDATIFAPNTYFVVKAGFATVPSTPTAPVGSCESVFTVL